MTSTALLLVPPTIHPNHPRSDEIVDGWMAALDERGAEFVAVAEAEAAETAARIAAYEGLDR